jgi:hypothetical protein
MNTLQDKLKVARAELRLCKRAYGSAQKALARAVRAVDSIQERIDREANKLARAQRRAASAE